MKDALGERMKGFYENRWRIALPRRSNVLVRVDGKAFHTYTKGFKFPYDEALAGAMDFACKELCKNAQGAKFGYVQSDEISVLITDYDTLTTDAWFDYDQQKIASVSASIVTRAFNQKITEYFSDLESEASGKLKLAEFDARAWSMNEQEEVVNYFIWRQKDATKNSISALSRAHFSHKQIEKKNSSEKQEMLFTEKGINWNDVETGFKRGRAIYYRQENGRGEWVVDKEMPIITEDRNYVKGRMPAY
jgi:tRNA(His) 5'-end guanylyltransferase